jgi:ribose 5-phosphate isomerase B
MIIGCNRPRRFSLKRSWSDTFVNPAMKFVDFGLILNPDDDYRFVIPLAELLKPAVDRVWQLRRQLGLQFAPIRYGIHAALIHDHFSARQGVEDDHMNILMGGRTVGPAVAWDLVGLSGSHVQ